MHEVSGRPFKFSLANLLHLPPHKNLEIIDILGTDPTQLQMYSTDHCNCAFTNILEDHTPMKSNNVRQLMASSFDDDFPQNFVDDAKLRRKFSVELANALQKGMDESTWLEFAVLHGYEDAIHRQSRLLKAQRFGDDDYKGQILSVLRKLESEDAHALDYLVKLECVQQHLDQKLSALWINAFSGNTLAASQIAQELNDKSHIVSLSEYSARIKNALPTDPSLAIGTSKELLEATFRSIMDKKGKPLDRNADFPTQLGACFKELGLTPSTPPQSEAEKKVRQVTDSAKKMMVAINELRNLAGTGHGHSQSGKPVISVDDAQLVASASMALATWMISKSE